MMKQDQVLDADFRGDFHTFEPRGVSPAFARGRELFGSVLRIVDENVRARRQLPKTLVELRIPRLVVSGINDRSGGGIKTKAQAALRMVQPGGLYPRARDVEHISPGDFRKIALR